MLRRKRTESSMTERVSNALGRMRELLPLDDCEVELRDLRAGIATIRVAGSCSHCRMDAAALSDGISAHIRSSVPEITEVRIEVAGAGDAGSEEPMA
jgi:Fe-S cluster biogenesis protein NfuA